MILAKISILLISLIILFGMQYVYQKTKIFTTSQCKCSNKKNKFYILGIINILHLIIFGILIFSLHIQMFFTTLSILNAMIIIIFYLVLKMQLDVCKCYDKDGSEYSVVASMVFPLSAFIIMVFCIMDVLYIYIFS